MKIGLFIPCYIDQFYPEVGKATLSVLEGIGVEVVYPMGQTCCGQPLANGGHEGDTRRLCRKFVDLFQDFDHIVSPSGSCTYHVKHHFDVIEQNDAVLKVRSAAIELCDFIVNIMGITDLGAWFPHKVGLHKSCHGLRGLNLGTYSEMGKTTNSVMEKLLHRVEGLELIKLNRDDECCGFGGTFAIGEEAVSVKMGVDRIQDHLNNKAEVITGTDTSCLMHMEGLINRQKHPLRVMHIAEILNSKKH
jgi:L-lactate dehydrogenase complex protein LldE